MADRPNQEQVAVAPPQEVQTAFKLGIAYAAVGVVSGLLTLVVVDEWLALVGVVLPAVPPGLESAMAVAKVIGGIVGTVISLGLELLLLVKMRAGRNWARIVLTVVGAAILASGLINVDGTLAPVALGLVGALIVVLAVAQIALIAVAIYFMWRPASSEFFAR